MGITTDTLYDLRQYIVSAVGVNCEIGDNDIADDQKPFLKIIPNNTITANFMNTHLNSLDFPVELRIIVDKGQELKALDILDRLMRKINQFNSNEGHRADETIEAEYIEDKKTYELAVNYKLKLLEHDDT